MIRRILRIILRVFISAFIAFLSISIIILIILLFITNHKVFFKYAGIIIDHDCQIEKGHFTCSYYRAYSKDKSFDIEFTDLDGSIIFKNFLEDKPIFKADIGNIKGYYSAVKKRKKTTRSLLPIYTFYVLSKFVNLYLKNGNFKLYLPEREIILDKLNLKVENTAIYNITPISVDVDGYNAILKKIKLKLTENTVFLEQLKTSVDNQIFISLSGYLSISRQLYANGEIYVPYIDLYENQIKKLKGFFVVRKDTRFKPVAFRILTTTDQLINKNENLYIKEIRTFNVYRFKNLDDFNGKSFISISNIYLDRLSASRISVDLTVSRKKDRYTGKINITSKDVKLKNYVINDSSIDISFTKWKTLYLDGYIKTDLINAHFRYSNKQSPVFTLNTQEFRLKKIVNFLKPKRKDLFLIEGTARVDLSYFPDNSTANIKITGKQLNIFGVHIERSDTNLNIDILKNSVDLSGTAQSDTTRLFYTGKIKNRNLLINLNYNNLDLSNLIFTNRFDFSAVVSGSGYIRGDLLSPEIMLYGKSDQVKYKQIFLDNVSYALLYKNKKLTVVGEKKEERITTNVFIDFMPFFMLIDIYGIDSDITVVNPYLQSMLPKVFEKIKLQKATGNVKIRAKKNFWSLNLNVDNATAFLVPIKDVIFGYGKGTISKEKSNLIINFYNENLNVLNKKISVKGNFELQNKDFFLELSSTKFEGFDSFDAKGFIFTQIDKEKITGNVWLKGKKDKISFVNDILITGNLKKIGGISKLSVKQNGYVALNSTFNYLVTILENKIKSHIFTEKVDLHIFTENKEKAFSLFMEKIDIETSFEKDKYPQMQAIINSITLTKDDLNILYTDPIKVKVEEKSIYVDPFRYTGILDGVLKKLTYEINSQLLTLYTDGKIGKEIIPQLLQFFSLKGDIKYQIQYEGPFKDIKQNTYVKLYSSDLIIGTPYVIGTINIDRLLVEYKKILNIEIKGKTVSSLFGENPIQIVGWAKINPLTYSLKTNVEMLPVKYENLFVGTLNSNLDVLTKKDQGHIIKGDISVSGRSKLPISYLTEKRDQEEKPPVFEKVYLDINLTTFSPVYIYSNWGNVYAEASLHITGTLAKPVLNGEINITYGKIYIAKNLYNVDFINIRIIDNRPFVNARLSTNIAQTFIYLNITGPIDDLQFDYVSTPPKTREEILAILFLKETPAALAELPFFALVGKIIRTIFPASPEKGGIFQTGFEISINPKYSPIQGIIASIYARKSITRRLYIAISRPILQTVTELFGWYELGFKITERTAIVFRQYENNITETEITFSLPFDF